MLIPTCTNRLPSSDDVALDDLPIKLLQRLMLDRPTLNDPEDRPACAGLYTEFLFDHREGRRGARAVPEEIQRSALRFCADCPLVEKCRAEGDATREEGLWGGVYRRWSHAGRKRIYESFDLLELNIALPA